MNWRELPFSWIFPSTSQIIKWIVNGTGRSINISASLLVNIVNTDSLKHEASCGLCQELGLSNTPACQSWALPHSLIAVPNIWWAETGSTSCTLETAHSLNLILDIRCNAAWPLSCLASSVATQPCSNSNIYFLLELSFHDDLTRH